MLVLGRFCQVLHLGDVVRLMLDMVSGQLIHLGLHGVGG